MAKLKRTRVKRRLVFDIGSRAVRLCEFSQTKTGLQLTRYHQREFAIEPSMEEDEKRRIRSDVIKQLLKETKIRHKKTVFGLPGQSIFNRTRALPPVPEHKVTQIVRYEIQQQIPFALDQIAFDYQVLQRTDAGGYDVLMAAIKVDVVEKHLAILQDIKRQIDIVDVCPLAAYNWLKYTGEFGEEGECVAFIDMGASTTDIVIERGNQFRFARPLSIGGDTITEGISKAFGMSFVEAERLKKERGFAPTGDPRRDGKGGEVIGQSLSRLVSEITRTFAYFRSQPGGGPVSRVIVAGGGACLRNIVPYLQRELGLEVRIAQPLSGLAIGPGAQEVNEYPEQACVALGLALRCCQTVPIEINLIPPRIIEGARRRERALYWILSGITFGLILASIIPANARKHELVRKQIDEVTQCINMYDPKVIQFMEEAAAAGIGTTPSTTSTTSTASGSEKGSAVAPKALPERKSKFEGALEEARERVRAQQQQITVLDDAYKNRPDWIKYLVAINDARPKGKGVWFSDVESCVIEEGTAQSGQRPGERGGSGGGGGLRPPSGAAPGFGAGGAAAPGGGGAAGTGALGGEGAAGTAPGAAGAGVPAEPEISVSGFSGVLPTKGTSADMGMSRGSRGSGGSQARSAAPVQKGGQPKKPNGISIVGFASDPDVVWEFVDNLKASDLFKEGVHFDQRSANRVSPFVLDNAPVTIGSSSGSTAAGPADTSGSGRTGLGGLRSGGTTSISPTFTPTTPSVSIGGAENTLTSFVIHVQYAKATKSQAPARAAAPAAPTALGRPAAARQGDAAGEGDDAGTDAENEGSGSASTDELDLP